MIFYPVPHIMTGVVSCTWWQRWRLRRSNHRWAELKASIRRVEARLASLVRNLFFNLYPTLWLGWVSCTCWRRWRLRRSNHRWAELKASIRRVEARLASLVWNLFFSLFPTVWLGGCLTHDDDDDRGEAIIVGWNWLVFVLQLANIRYLLLKWVTSFLLHHGFVSSFYFLCVLGWSLRNYEASLRDIILVASINIPDLQHYTYC